MTRTVRRTGYHLAGALLLTVGLAACTAPPNPNQLETILLSDPAITTTIQSSYFADELVKPLNIDVDTDNGVVTLQGHVTSTLERDRAIRIAENTEGVEQVVDQLAVVLPSVPSDPLDPSRVLTEDEYVDPVWITTTIEAQYFLDPDVKGRNVDVTTTGDGTVTLRGEVDSATARQQALAIARDANGVTEVVDELTTATDEDATPVVTRIEQAMAEAGDEVRDAWTTARIQALYFVDGDIKDRDIEVTTNLGVVTLSGSVDTHAQKRDAMAIATDVDGVERVEDRLVVAPPAADTTDDATVPITDAWITTKIQAQYFLAADVSGLAIDVTTEDRVVTLEGDVESETQKALAAEIARDTTGVRDIVNQLVVNSSAFR